MSPYVTTPPYTVHHVARVYTQMVSRCARDGVVYGGVVSLYVRSCESSSSWRAAASSDAIEDLPTPEGPQRRISCPAAPPPAGPEASAMFGQDNAFTKNSDKECDVGISLKSGAKLTPNKRI